MRRHLLTAAAVATALVAFAQPASAQQYRSYHDEHVSTQQQCQTSRNNRTAGGAVVGGVIGALLGREVADRGVRGEGAGLGAVVGAVAGGAIGRSTARCDQVQGQYDQNTVARSPTANSPITATRAAIKTTTSTVARTMTATTAATIAIAGWASRSPERRTVANIAKMS